MTHETDEDLIEIKAVTLVTVESGFPARKGQRAELMNRKQAHIALADGTSAKQPDTSHLCSQCHVRPRLGALSRCGECVRVAAEVDRQSRHAAEISRGNENERPRGRSARCR